SPISIFWGFSLIGTEGFEIDLSNNQYRRFNHVLGRKSGKWINFRNPDYVSIYYTTITQKIGGRSLSSTAEATISAKRYVVNLFDQDNRPQFLFMSKEKFEASKIAIEVSELLNIRLVNKTV